MLNITVSNFRGIKDARIECSRIALLCGQNEQGKSSTIDAIRAVLAGTAAPYGLKKDNLATELIYAGSDQAVATIVQTNEGHDDRTMQMRWPAGDVQTMGTPFRATSFAIGAQYLTDMTERERAQVLAKYLRTEPTEDEFREAMADSGLGKEQIDAAHKDTVSLGWDGAWEKHKTEGTKLKGGWETLTGEKYGTSKGGNWRPKGWTPEHEQLTDDDIAGFLKESQEALEAAVGKVAINEDEKKRLEMLVKTMPKLQELVTTREKDGKRAKDNLTKAEDALKKIPVLPPDKWPACPHCQKAVQVSTGRGGVTVLAIPPKQLDEAERKKIEDQVYAAEQVLKEAHAEYDKCTTEWTTANNDLTKAKDAKAQLEQSDASGEKIDMDALRAALAADQSVANAKTKIRAALAKHVEVMQKLTLVNVLAPDGLRQAKLDNKIKAFNEERLAPLCTIAGWDAVTLDPTGDASLNGRRYDLCSRSGKMRIDVTLQVALGLIDGSEIFLIDDADMMDGKGRNGLFALIDHTEAYGIVGMMLTKVGQAPDLAAAGLGCTYWIEGAASAPLEEIKAKAA